MDEKLGFIPGKSSKYHRYQPGQKRVSCWRKGAEELSQGKRKTEGLGYTQDEGEDESDIDSDLKGGLDLGDAFALTEMKNSYDSQDSMMQQNEKSNFKSTLKKVQNDHTAQPVAKKLKIKATGDSFGNILSSSES